MSENQKSSTLDKIRRLEHRLATRKMDALGLFETYFLDLIRLRELRHQLAREMVADVLGVQDNSATLKTEGNLHSDKEPFDQVEYDHLILVDKEDGDYGTKEYIFEGQLGVYRIRVSHSITDESTLLDVYQNDKMFVTLYRTNTRGVYTGKDEEGEYYLFRFTKEGIDVFKRNYDL